MNVPELMEAVFSPTVDVTVPSQGAGVCSAGDDLHHRRQVNEVRNRAERHCVFFMKGAIDGMVADSELSLVVPSPAVELPRLRHCAGMVPSCRKGNNVLQPYLDRIRQVIVAIGSGQGALAGSIPRDPYLLNPQQ